MGHHWEGFQGVIPGQALPEAGREVLDPAQRMKELPSPPGKALAEPLLVVLSCLVGCVTLPGWFQTVVSAPLLWEQSWPAFKGLAHVLPLGAEGDVGFQQ